MNAWSIFAVLLVVGVLVLAGSFWLGAKIAWRTVPHDVAPRTHLPSLHELKSRRDAKWGKR